MYKPQSPFNVPFKILSLEKVFINGVNSTTYSESNEVYYCSVRSFGGTEKTLNNVYVIEDTIEVETYYIPNLKSKDRIKLLDDNSIYEVINTPENISRRNQFLKFKGLRVHG